MSNNSSASSGFCFEFFRKICFISAAKYVNVFTIVRETDELGFEVSFRSSIKGSFDLRIHKTVLGDRQRIELKSITLFSTIAIVEKHLRTIKLPIANFRFNNRSNQMILLGKLPSVSRFSKSFFHHISLKWNSLRDTSVSLLVFKSRLKSFLVSESYVVPVHSANTWSDFRFK